MQELKRSMDELTREWEPFEELSEEEYGRAQASLAGFRAAGSDLLDGATPHLWAYHRWVIERLAAENLDADEVPHDDDLWESVRFELPPIVVAGGQRLQPAAFYVSFQGPVSWEKEHGLDLVFEDGVRLVKLGPYDGHCTHAHARGDESLVGQIFVG